MAGGWAKDGSVQEQIDASVADAVKRIRNQIPQGKSREDCEECGASIPDARRKAVPGVHLCVKCQSSVDQAQETYSGYNRRGSKDSQLR
jgi:phage/conjugal plasmid C-4 type zinc finger TraR family protein